MDSKKTPLQRAFEMARSGACMGLADLIRDLNKEGYDCRQVEGPSLKKQLSALIKERKATDVRLPDGDLRVPDEVEGPAP